jgi:hypothetical protein
MLLELISAGYIDSEAFGNINLSVEDGIFLRSILQTMVSYTSKCFHTRVVKDQQPHSGILSRYLVQIL